MMTSKKIIIESLQWLSENKRTHIHGFVVMPNHVHILWTILTEKPQHPETTFVSYTAHQFKAHLLKTDQHSTLQQFVSSQNDRDYHFWERRSLSKPIVSREMAFQKLEYIHLNPVRDKWDLAKNPEDYFYSSAAYYQNGDNNFPFLVHLHGYI